MLPAANKINYLHPIMAEKNTLSILQNIKKKMQKFDQEPQKIDTVAGINDEFEYIPSSKAKADAKIEVAAAQAKTNPEVDVNAALEIYKDLQFAENSVAAMAKEQAPKPAANNDMEDDLGLDDLSDLEDHVPAPVAPKDLPVAPVFPAAPAQEIGSHDDFELDLDEDDHQLHEVSKVESVKAAPVHEEEHHDDLDFDLDLDLDEDDQQDLDDLDLNKLLTEEELMHNKANLQAQKVPEVPAAKTAAELEDEEFLKNLEPIPPLTPPTLPPAPALAHSLGEVEANAEKSISDELLHDADLDELDDMEDQLFVDETPAPQVIQNQEVENQAVVEVREAKKENAIEPLDMSAVLSEKKSELELMLRNQNFAEIAMHLLEPKLDTWLDQHLHDLVEKIVQEEVKRLFEKR